MTRECTRTPERTGFSSLWDSLFSGSSSLFIGGEYSNSVSLMLPDLRSTHSVSSLTQLYSEFVSLSQESTPITKRESTSSSWRSTPSKRLIDRIKSLERSRTESTNRNSSRRESSKPLWPLRLQSRMISVSRLLPTFRISQLLPRLRPSQWVPGMWDLSIQTRDEMENESQQKCLLQIQEFLLQESTVVFQLLSRTFLWNTLECNNFIRSKSCY